MVHVVVSTGEDGRSRVVSSQSMDDAQGLTILWDFELAGLKVPPAPGEPRDLGVPADRGAWKFIRQAPGAVGPMHHTLTMDLWVILQGSCDLLLDEGSVALTAGDVVRCEGASHGWQWGPEGCTIISLNLGATTA